MKKKLIDLHWEWMETGELTKCNGLCTELEETEYEKSMNLFKPNYQQRFCAYWAADKKDFTHYDTYSLSTKYTTTRQSIVLLICAMHNEI